LNVFLGFFSEVSMANSKWFGGRLRELREAAELTRQELADKAQVSVDGISQWERGVREPSWSIVIALSEALGTDCKAFLKAPADREPFKPGRPARGKAETVLPGEKKKRGRPQKGQ
jgi:transcriptional regulator with XRE-family HTH domain